MHERGQILPLKWYFLPEKLRARNTVSYLHLAQAVYLYSLISYEILKSVPLFGLP